MHKLCASHLLGFWKDWQRLIMKALSLLMLSSWPHVALPRGCFTPTLAISPEGCWLQLCSSR